MSFSEALGESPYDVCASVAASRSPLAPGFRTRPHAIGAQDHGFGDLEDCDECYTVMGEGPAAGGAQRGPLDIRGEVHAWSPLSRPASPALAPRDPGPQPGTTIPPMAWESGGEAAAASTASTLSAAATIAGTNTQLRGRPRRPIHTGAMPLNDAGRVRTARKRATFGHSGDVSDAQPAPRKVRLPTPNGPIRSLILTRTAQRAHTQAGQTSVASFPLPPARAVGSAVELSAVQMPSQRLSTTRRKAATVAQAAPQQPAQQSGVPVTVPASPREDSHSEFCSVAAAVGLAVSTGAQKSRAWSTQRRQVNPLGPSGGQWSDFITPPVAHATPGMAWLVVGRQSGGGAESRVPAATVPAQASPGLEELRLRSDVVRLNNIVLQLTKQLNDMHRQQGASQTA